MIVVGLDMLLPHPVHLPFVYTPSNLAVTWGGVMKDSINYTSIKTSKQ
jgi:hypothetical protein